MGILSVIEDNVEVVTDEAGWVRAGVVQVRHLEVAGPGISIVERHEGRACRWDRLIVCWTMRVRMGVMGVPLRERWLGKRPTISIVGEVVGWVAEEQQVWSDEVGGPGCVNNVAEVVCRDRVDVRVQPFVGGVGPGEECGYEDGDDCEVEWLGRRGRAVWRVHRIAGEGLEPMEDGEVVKCV